MTFIKKKPHTHSHTQKTIAKRLRFDFGKRFICSFEQKRQDVLGVDEGS
jgi:hypothetical protein